jgi:hypothetical protein
MGPLNSMLSVSNEISSPFFSPKIFSTKKSIPSTLIKLIVKMGV